MFFLREHHFSVSDLAELWGIHPKTLRNIFADEPDVIRISRRTSPHKRPPRPERGRPRDWVMLRIPESVAKRVYERLRRGGK